jgi:pseudaminic acid biosynthesis-associated methylase
MGRLTSQMKEWGGDFGRSYTDRNPRSFEEMDALYLEYFGMTRTQLNHEFLGDLSRSTWILEVGSNVGTQLQGLRLMGFRNLFGIELQSYAVASSRIRLSNVNLFQGSVFEIPFKDGVFDLILSSGLLIHISPDDIDAALDEIYRCTKRYIWGMEYFSDRYTVVPYRGEEDLLWKTDFTQLYLDRFPGLELIRERRIQYLNSDNMDAMFLLEK